MGSTDIGVITSGIAYQYAREAFGDVSYLKLGMIYPLPDKLIKEFPKSKSIICIEELEPFFEEHIRNWNQGYRQGFTARYRGIQCQPYQGKSIWKTNRRKEN